MEVKYIIQSIIIILIFSYLQLINILSISIKDIQQNWEIYRCNPLIIPIAGIFGYDSMKTFKSCVDNYNVDLSEKILQPFRYILNNLNIFGEDIGKNLGGLINFTSASNSGIFSIVNTFLGTSTNILVSFQLIILGFRDTFSKIIGTLITFLYILKGIETLVPSMLLTPPGQAILWIVQTLGQTAKNTYLPNT